MKIFWIFCVLPAFFSLNIEDLVDKENIESIIEYHNKDFGDGALSKTFVNDVLIFVTPWNRDGITYTKKFAKKIDFVSPVWFDLKSKLRGKNNLEVLLEGEHNIDINYINELKEANDQIKIVPRIYLSSEDQYIIQGMKEDIPFLVNVFSEYLRKFGNQVDGIVFDSPFISYMSSIDADFLEFLSQVSNLFHDNEKIFITSLMAMNEGNNIRRRGDINKLLTISDKVLVCTYDYNNAQPGTRPISPYKWVKKNIEYFGNELDLDYDLISQKILMGVPFYGFKIENSQKLGHLIANEYIEILKGGSSKFIWNEETKECEITSNFKKTNLKIFYPCLKFIKERLALFEDANFGMFVWDGGQGLQYFYELL